MPDGNPTQVFHMNAIKVQNYGSRLLVECRGRLQYILQYDNVISSPLCMVLGMYRLVPLNSEQPILDCTEPTDD
jgi:hypothetical protein